MNLLVNIDLVTHVALCKIINLLRGAKTASLLIYLLCAKSVINVIKCYDRYKELNLYGGLSPRPTICAHL